MEYRNLGRTGLKVSPLCMGTMQFGWGADEAAALRIFSAAYETGINFIDTADVYSRWVTGNPGGVAETIIGRWLTGAHIPRERVVIATKVRGRMGEGPNDEGLSRVHILQAVEASLQRLQTDYIDLYQTHSSDPHTPIEETLGALDDLVRQGKVRYIGASNYTAWELMQAMWASDRNGLVRFESLQPHYNLVHRDEFERELQAVCRTYGLGVIPYSPLAGGFLTGKYRKDKPAPKSVRAGRVQERYFSDRNFALLSDMDRIAAAHKASVSQVALAWMLTDPVITSPIVGPTSAEQLEDNLGALALELTVDERNSLEAATRWRDRE